MKQTTKMSRAVSQLEHIYNSLNTDFFAGELPTPIITVQSKPGTYGHCTTAKVWQRKDNCTYELNIAAEVLNYPIEETLDIGWRLLGILPPSELRRIRQEYLDKYYPGFNGEENGEM